jgi:hypothetical protein
MMDFLWIFEPKKVLGLDPVEEPDDLLSPATSCVSTYLECNTKTCSSGVYSPCSAGDKFFCRTNTCSSVTCATKYTCNTATCTKRLVCDLYKGSCTGTTK